MAITQINASSVSAFHLCRNWKLFSAKGRKMNGTPLPTAPQLSHVLQPTYSTPRVYEAFQNSLSGMVQRPPFPPFTIFSMTNYPYPLLWKWFLAVFMISRIRPVGRETNPINPVVWTENAFKWTHGWSCVWQNHERTLFSYPLAPSPEEGAPYLFGLLRSHHRLNPM